MIYPINKCFIQHADPGGKSSVDSAFIRLPLKRIMGGIAEHDVLAHATPATS